MRVITVSFLMLSLLLCSFLLFGCQEKTWQLIEYRVGGSERAFGETERISFTTRSSEWRIWWKLSITEAIGKGYIRSGDQEIAETIGFRGPATRSGYFYGKDKGTFQFEVFIRNGSWEIKIEEYR